MKKPVTVLFVFVVTCAVAFGKSDTDIATYSYVPNLRGIFSMVNLRHLNREIKPLFNIENDVTFELFTSRNPENRQIITPFDFKSIVKSNFNSSNPTRFILHGWQERGEVLKTFTKAFFSKGNHDVNLIYVNWEKTSLTFNYISARRSVNEIGPYVAQFIDFMIDNGVLKLADINLIGFSLGAHVAGIAGKNVRSGKLPKIVGLDPAGPLFSLNKPYERLDAHDAEYVEVVHTNGEFLGFYDPIGTTNFYPNSGWTQRGCLFDLTGICSHLRSYKYYAESVYSNVPFYGYLCKSMQQMKKGNCAGVGARMGGEPGVHLTHGHIYYLKTNAKAEYAVGEPSPASDIN